MADSQNNIVIQVVDKVPTTIAPKLDAISHASLQAESSLTKLKNSLSGMNTSGLNGLNTAVRSSNSATNLLNSSTQKMGQTAVITSLQVDRLTQSYVRLDQTLVASLASIQAYAAGLANAASSSQVMNASQVQLNTGMRSVGSNAMGTTAAISMLEGRTLGANRAAAAMLTRFMGLGPVLQMAFPVIGAIALIEVLAQVVAAVGKVVTAYQRMQKGALDAELQAQETGQKLLKLKPDAGLNAAAFARAIAGDYGSQHDILVENAKERIKEFQYTRELADAQAAVNEKGLQGLQLQQQRVKTAQSELESYKKEKAEVQALADHFKGMLTATHDVTRYVSSGPGLAAQPITSSVRNIQDEGQIKKIEEQRAAAIQQVDQLNHQIDLMGVKLIGINKEEPLATIKDNAKAAREQLKEFDLELSRLKQGSKVVTPQDELELFRKQMEVALPQNTRILEQREGNAQQAILRQKSVDDISQSLKDQVADIGLYNDALKEKQKWDQIELRLTKDRVEITPQLKEQLQGYIKTIVESKDYQQALNRVYEDAHSPIDTYQASLQAVQKLLADHEITQAQANEEIRKAQRIYTDSILPLNEYVRQMRDQVDLFGKFGPQLTVANEMQRVNNDLRAKNKVLTADESRELENFLTQLERQKRIQSDIAGMYEQNAGALQKLAEAQDAVNEAAKRGIISDEQRKISLAKITVQVSDLNLTMNKGTVHDQLVSTIGKYVANYQGLAKGLADTYNRAFTQIADGAADSLGRAIAYGDDLGESLKNVARSAISELISGLIKLGIQWVVMQYLGDALATTAIATTVASAAAASAAWAPAAAFASLATLGANAAPADTALVTTVGLSQLLGAVKFSGGGYVTGPGTGTSDSVPSLLSNGEFVMNAAATSANRSALEMMNRGASVGRASSGTNLNVNVIHDGSTAIDVQQVDQNTVHVIATRAAEKAVALHAPSIIASDIQNPNSKTAKSIKTRFAVPMRR